MVPKDRDTLTVYPKNIDPEFDIIPQHVRDEISTLNKLASELYNKHQDFIVYCKNICSKISANKAFKSDSQRLAYFIPSLSFVFTVAWLGFVVALLTP